MRSILSEGGIIGNLQLVEPDTHDTCKTGVVEYIDHFTHHEKSFLFIFI